MLSTGCPFFAGWFVVEVRIGVKKETRPRRKGKEGGEEELDSNFLPTF